MPSILYLHGFHSSPMSAKALSFNTFVATHYPHVKVLMPQLPSLPKQAIKCVDDLVHDHFPDLVGVVGSSLGGYLCTYLHNKYDLPAVVINPAVKPFELLNDYIGPQTHPITGQDYELTSKHMLELKAIYQPNLKTPHKVWCLQQEGDEVLDYRQAKEHYQAAKLTVEAGGDHSFIGFDRYLKQIMDFLL